jgi:HAD superfamily hydrolase (TIGR01509 family)
MKFELVAFDCDGVLVDTEPVVNRVFLRLLAETGPTLDEGRSLSRFTGASMPSRIATIRGEHGWVPPADFERAFDHALTLALSTELRVIPGVEAVVRSLRGPRCVVSNGSRAEMTLKLTQAGLLDAFAPNLFTAADVPRSKPFPDVYLHATAALGFAPGVSAAVEDSKPGVQAAIAAGLTVFAYAAATPGEELSRLGARVFTDMAELGKLLNER